MKPPFAKSLITVVVWHQSVGGSLQIVALAAAVVIGIVFLNDFGYDDDAGEWFAWSYLENMMEGEKLDVAWQKNRGV